jgi:protein SCO1/2
MPSASFEPTTAVAPRARRAVPLTFAILAAGVLAVLLGVGVVLAGLARSGSDEPPVLGVLPAFALTNERGEPFGSADLRGKVWVANFIFTRCPTVCPLFTRKMGSLQPMAGEFGTALHLVSFSVDPQYDRPEVLRAYAEKAGADPSRWTFLTGDAEAIRATVMEGFKVSVGREGPAEDFAGIFHGTQFVLVDGEGRVRGYYASGEAEAVDKLRREMALLARAASAR